MQPGDRIRRQGELVHQRVRDVVGGIAADDGGLQRPGAEGAGGEGGDGGAGVDAGGVGGGEVGLDGVGDGEEGCLFGRGRGISFSGGVVGRVEGGDG